MRFVLLYLIFILIEAIKRGESFDTNTTLSAYISADPVLVPRA